MERWKANVRLTFDEGTKKRTFPVHVTVPDGTPIVDIVDQLEEAGWLRGEEEGIPMSQCEECTTDCTEEQT